MNRLVCPSCQRPSYCASLSGPLRCAYQDCGALILPGDEVALSNDRRARPRINTETEISVEYLVEDKRIIEEELPFEDASVIGISTVLDHYPPLGSHVIVQFSNAGEDGSPWRARGVVKEVRPAKKKGFRVGIEVIPSEVPPSI
ncbi:MAG: hypothetical protein ACE5HV_10035 [Acidobacteriota bacterium]